MVTSELTEGQFMTIWEAIALLRHGYDRLFYSHFHRIARQKFLLRRIATVSKY